MKPNSKSTNKKAATSKPKSSTAQKKKAAVSKVRRIKQNPSTKLSKLKQTIIGITTAGKMKTTPRTAVSMTGDKSEPAKMDKNVEIALEHKADAPVNLGLKLKEEPGTMPTRASTSAPVFDPLAIQEPERLIPNDSKEAARFRETKKRRVMALTNKVLEFYFLYGSESFQTDWRKIKVSIQDKRREQFYEKNNVKPSTDDRMILIE